MRLTVTRSEPKRLRQATRAQHRSGEIRQTKEEKKAGHREREREKEKGRDGGRESKSEEQNRQGQVTPFPVAMR